MAIFKGLQHITGIFIVLTRNILPSKHFLAKFVYMYAVLVFVNFVDKKEEKKYIYPVDIMQENIQIYMNLHTPLKVHVPCDMNICIGTTPLA